MEASFSLDHCTDFPPTVTTVTVTLFGLNWVYLAAKKTGYSDIPLIVTLLAVLNGVTVTISWAFIQTVVIVVLQCLRSYVNGMH